MSFSVYFKEAGKNQTGGYRVLELLFFLHFDFIFTQDGHGLFGGQPFIPVVDWDPEGFLQPVTENTRFFDPGTGASVHAQWQPDDDLADLMPLDQILKVAPVLFRCLEGIHTQHLGGQLKRVTEGQAEVFVAVIDSQDSPPVLPVFL